MPLYMRRALVMAKIESTYGTDPTPAGVDAVLLRNLRIKPMAAEFAPRDLIRSFFGNSENLPAAIHAEAEFEIEVAGSGAVATAPKWGMFMRACAMSETTTAADVTGAAQAGAATTVTLAAGASAVDNFYNGMKVDITAGTGSGSTGIIVGYVGATKIATVAAPWVVNPAAASTYAIRANVQYRGVSTAMESVAFVCNYDGVQHKFLGGRGKVSLTLNAKGIPVWKYSLMGLYQTVTDTAQVTPDYAAWKSPITANSTNTPVFHLHGVTPVVDTFAMDLAQNAIYRALIGFEQVLVTDRKPKGSIKFDATLVATKDWWTIAKNATLGPAAFRHGAVGGNIVQCSFPAVQIEPPEYEDSDGVLMVNAGLIPVPVLGNDEAYITSM
ncbi:MAG: hypothetical protein IPP91_11310 [Betaproteobacteria bacterium]|nr:hypothetical protein [Betaproteobacteria bacterium]